MNVSPDKIFRLTYLSSATSHLLPVDLEAILASARKRNPALDVTGLLIFHDGNFFQALEGEEETVLSLFRRIGHDPRHKGCIALERRSVPTRLFPDWGMAFRRPVDLGASQLEAFREIAKLCDESARGRPEGTDSTQRLIDSFLNSFRDL